MAPQQPPQTRLSFLLAAAAGVIFLCIALFAIGMLQYRVPEVRYASALKLDQRHLRNIAAVMGVKFPDGTELRHASHYPGRDPSFKAVVALPPGAWEAWAATPPADYQVTPPTTVSSLGYPASHPWAQELNSHTIHGWWSRTESSVTVSSITVLAPDESGTALVVLGCGNQNARRLSHVVPRSE